MLDCHHFESGSRLNFKIWTILQGLQELAKSEFTIKKFLKTAQIQHKNVPRCGWFWKAEMSCSREVNLEISDLQLASNKTKKSG